MIEIISVRQCHNWSRLASICARPSHCYTGVWSCSTFSAAGTHSTQPRHENPGQWRSCSEDPWQISSSKHRVPNVAMCVCVASEGLSNQIKVNQTSYLVPTFATSSGGIFFES